MNINFRKLKNSLLSLGLSATLFCTAGLAGLPVFATDPIREVALRECVIGIGRGAIRYSRGKARAVFVAIVNQLVNLASVAAKRGVIGPDGRPVPLHCVLPLIPLGRGAFMVHTQLLAEVAKVSKSSVNSNWCAIGYNSSTPTPAQIAQLEMQPHQCRSWTVRTLRTPESTGEPEVHADEAHTDAPTSTPGGSFAQADWPELSLPEQPEGYDPLADTDTGSGEYGFFERDVATEDQRWLF
jgi:hypothetical protein